MAAHVNTAASIAATNVHQEPVAARTAPTIANDAITRSATAFAHRRAEPELATSRSTSARLASW